MRSVWCWSQSFQQFGADLGRRSRCPTSFLNGARDIRGASSPQRRQWIVSSCHVVSCSWTGPHPIGSAADRSTRRTGTAGPYLATLQHSSEPRLGGRPVPRTAFAGTGFYVPDRASSPTTISPAVMDTSDEWIVERTGHPGATVGLRGDDRRGHGTPTPVGDGAGRRGHGGVRRRRHRPRHAEPRPLLSGHRGVPPAGAGAEGIPALDIRAQCSGSSTVCRWPTRGSARASTGRSSWWGWRSSPRDSTCPTEGRDMAVLFGDGAGAAVLVATDDDRTGSAVHPPPRRRAPRRGPVGGVRLLEAPPPHQRRDARRGAALPPDGRARRSSRTPCPACPRWLRRRWRPTGCARRISTS